MSEAIFRKRAARAGEVGLFPVDDEGSGLLGKLKLDRDFGVTVTRHRNPRHHRLYFAILKFIKDHSTLFENADPEIISTAVKIATGHVRTFIDTTTGQTAFVPKSIAWAAMDQTEFEAFFQNACDVIAQRWMPAGTASESVRDELILMVDGRHALGRRVA